MSAHLHDTATFLQLQLSLRLDLTAFIDRNTDWRSRSHAAARVWGVAHGSGLLYDIANVAESFIEGDMHAGLAAEALGAGDAGGEPRSYRHIYLGVWLEKRAATAETDNGKDGGTERKRARLE